MVEIVCVTCGDTFRVSKYRARTGAKFCKRSCVRHTDETRKKMSEVQAGLKKRPRSESHRQNASLARLGKSHPSRTLAEGRKRVVDKAKKSEETRLKSSLAMTEKWKDTEHRAKVARSRARNPQRYRVSKAELALVPEMEKKGFEHTGDGKFFITGRDGVVHVPDFVNRKERKVFELWGDYWHRGEDPEALVVWYAEVGWEAEVRWLSEVGYPRLSS